MHGPVRAMRNEGCQRTHGGAIDSGKWFWIGTFHRRGVCYKIYPVRTHTWDIITDSHAKIELHLISTLNVNRVDGVRYHRSGTVRYVLSHRTVGSPASLRYLRYLRVKSPRTYLPLETAASNSYRKSAF